MQTSDVTLVVGDYALSEASLQAWLVLRHTGIAFEEVRVPILQEDGQQFLDSISPGRSLPVLLFGDTACWRNIAIIETLAEFIPEIWPSDPRERLEARSIASHAASGFPYVRRLIPLDLGHSFGDPGKLIRAVEQELELLESFVSARFAARGEGFLFGSFCAADAMLAPHLLRCVYNAIPLGPASEAYARHLIEQDFVAEWLSMARVESREKAQGGIGLTRRHHKGESLDNIIGLTQSAPMPLIEDPSSEKEPPSEGQRQENTERQEPEEQNNPTIEAQVQAEVEPALPFFIEPEAEENWVRYTDDDEVFQDGLSSEDELAAVQEPEYREINPATAGPSPTQTYHEKPAEPETEKLDKRQEKTVGVPASPPTQATLITGTYMHAMRARADLSQGMSPPTIIPTKPAGLDEARQEEIAKEARHETLVERQENEVPKTALSEKPSLRGPDFGPPILNTGARNPYSSAPEMEPAAQPVPEKPEQKVPPAEPEEAQQELPAPKPRQQPAPLTAQPDQPIRRPTPNPLLFSKAAAEPINKPLTEPRTRKEENIAVEKADVPPPPEKPMAYQNPAKPAKAVIKVPRPTIKPIGGGTRRRR